MTEEGSKEDHWNNWYGSRGVEELGWFQKELGPSLDLLNKCGLEKDARILDVGTGASSAFIDYLTNNGYANITATDLSQTAIDTQKKRLGSRGDLITWIQDDLTEPVRLHDMEPVTLWHDRAVLHFLTEPAERESYRAILNKVVAIGGFIIIAAFSLEGAERCSALPVYRYNEEMVVKFLGPEFELIDSLNYLYIMPSGNKRPYVYTLFRRKE